jgi:hypothetical protein
MAWRSLFAVAGVVIFIGGPMHPAGTMEEMLAHEDWFMAHALMTLAFGVMAAGLACFAREAAAPRLARWTRYAIIGTVVQTLEMAVHTAASVDHANLVAGAATPVLTTHMWMAVFLSPLFGISVAGFIIAGVRDGAVGSRWIAWLGVIGVFAYGLGPAMTVGVGEGWRWLFPAIMGLSIWLMLAAVWRVRSGVKTQLAVQA